MRRYCNAAMNFLWTLLALTALPWFLAACGTPLNDPYPDADAQINTLYESFSEPPRHLDPARSYATDEVEFNGQIYEPPLQYHYLKRPYTLIPLAATQVPTPQLLDANDQPLPDNASPEDVAYSLYTIQIKPGIRYYPHPASATNESGEPLYINLRPEDVEDISSPNDFKTLATRELRAADYVHQIKRLAHPRAHSPILGVMSEHIVGLSEFTDKLTQADKTLRAEQGDEAYLDLTQYDLEGAQVVDDTTYTIKLKGQYPQLRYWLAMPFFAPMAPEVTRFYAQSALTQRNIGIDTYPVGTGPYMLTENDPNRRMVLVENPNFHGERYPSEGEPGDKQQGLLQAANAPLPFIQRAIYSLEKESIPYWNKFLQGYYDASGIGSDSFGEAIRIDRDGKPHLTETMRDREIKLQTVVSPGVYYMGFNMQDSVVGGYDEKARALRQALSIAIDYESYIAIFLNGRGIAAQDPIPNGIYGHQEGEAGINPYVYDWINGEARRKSLDKARELLAKAGYPGGVSEETGKPLLINLDNAASGPQFKSQLDWYRKQFAKLNVQLVARSTTWSRFQQKMADGNVQMFQAGWLADYPDPENFLFLLYGPNGAADHNGQNAANYENSEFDRLFGSMRDMENGPQRLAVINQMLEIARRDAPWAWGFFPRQYTLHQAWLKNGKLNPMANNTLKYLSLEPELRSQKRLAWNDPVWWPLPVAGGLFVLALLPGIAVFIRRERKAPSKK